VDQVSKPVLIALAAVVVLVAAKFTVLRPKTDSGSTPAVATAPGQAGLQSAVDKANNAVGVSKQSATRSEQAAAGASGDSTAATNGGTAAPTKSAKPAPAKAAPAAKPLPKLEKGDRSGPILRDLAQGKVVVALFFNPHGADDNAALRAVRAADRQHGRVVVHSIPIEDVGDYNALTTDVQVLQAPTVLVIGPNHKARTIVGYTEVREIDQTVGDVGGRRFQAHPAKHLTGFASKASFICDGDEFRILTSGLPTSPSGIEAFLGKGERIVTRSRHRLAAIKAVGAKQVAAKHAVLAAYAGYAQVLQNARSGLKSGAAPGPVIATMVHKGDALTKQYQPALHAVHERHCLG
jgi:hypothetical protein